MNRIVWYALFTLACALQSAAQAIKVPESWDRLAAKADESVNVNLDRDMLGLASKSMNKKGDSDAKQLLSKLNGIYVRTLTFKKAGEFSDADVEPIRAQLQGPEWKHLVDVNNKKENEKVTIYLKKRDDQVMGLVVLAEEATELTFVQLDGPINAGDLGKLGGNFSIPKDIQTSVQSRVAGWQELKTKTQSGEKSSTQQPSTETVKK